MFFCWDITVAANTKANQPDAYWLSLPKGVITSIDFKFPSGCHGMVRARLFQESLQLVPLSEDEWVTGDDETVHTETYAELLDEPFKLKLQLCSPDTTYSHTITVRIGVHSEDTAGIGSLTKIVKDMKDALLGAET